jgi:hypothetical protein
VYKVLAAMRQDMNEGWAWLTDAGFEPRSIVRIHNKGNKQSVYCECLAIDGNFKKEYNQSPRVNIKPNEKTLIINGWYRKMLGGIKTNEYHDIEITASNGWWGKFRVNAGHPQTVVRIATWLALISVGLGVLGVYLGLK